MKKISLFLVAFGLSLAVCAQSAREEIRRNHCLSASNHVAYPGPVQQRLTPAPSGYEPFYLSHYGRHGSRYLIRGSEYLRPIHLLEHADSAGVLTATGRDVLHRIRMMYEESKDRWGELTPLGARQHREIARRMYERFPQVFADTVGVDAKSTVVIRCILSMENALQELVRLNPRLRITHDASEHDMYYMNQTDTALSHHKETPAVKAAYDKWTKEHVNFDHLMKTLFTQRSFVADSKMMTESDFVFRLFRLAGILQDSELRHKITLYDIFTDDELYTGWQQNNIWWYLHYGNTALNGGTQPFSQRNLLRNIIHEADSCLCLHHPGATLRFGHETMVLPLTCLLNINGYGEQIADIDRLEEHGWVNYRIFPMAANLQLVFYRNNKKPGDVLVKVLLNENEVRLPLPSDLAPYYRWSDFRRYYLAKLDGYRP